MAKKNTKKTKGERVLTSAFRVSYPKLVEKDELAGKYTLQMLFEPKDLKGLKATAKKVAKEAFGTDDVVMPFRDGSDKGFDEYVIVNAKSNFRPAVFDKKGNQITDPEEIRELIYGGCYARAQVVVLPYEFAGKQGITIALLGVQFVRDGEAFGGSSVSFDAIDEVEDDDWE